MFESCTFDCLKSRNVWAYSFDGSFRFPEECKDPLFSIPIAYYIAIYALFLTETFQKGFNGNKTWHISPHWPNK